MAALNLGIVAHVDAGKTSLTERLLYAAGVIDRVGRVDDGTTHTDTLALEKQRGITIRSAVVSFEIDGLTTNLIDTPGHSDFVAEVERVLGVLDAAVLVVSAVEGVQAQTRVLMRVLRRLRIPTVIFVNKIDRTGAAPSRVLAEIADRLTPDVVPMGVVRDEGTPGASFRAYATDDGAGVAALLDSVTRFDDALLAEVVEDPDAVTGERIRTAIAMQTARLGVCPVYFGSAVTGAGTEALHAGLASLHPTGDDDADADLSATVFKIERGPGGEKLVYVRIRAGTLRVRDRLTLPDGTEQKITAIDVFGNGTAERAGAAGQGRIARVTGLTAARVGHTLGAASAASRHQAYFSPPSLETIVDPCRAADAGALHSALTQLAEQDPLINLRRDDRRRETSVSLYGEVQKEVIAATLAADYGIDVTFRETTTICVERPNGSGAAVEFIDTEPNPFLATVGLRVDPAPAGTGVEFRLGVELGSMPRAFFTAVERSVRETLGQGLCGWEVVDCVVTMTYSGYWARQSHAHGTFDASMSSTAGDFRLLTPLVLIDALKIAGTRVEEPIHRFELEVPRDNLGGVLATLPPLGGVPLETRPAGSSYLLVGDVPAAQVHRLQLLVPTLTNGEGMLDTEFDHYRPVRGDPPTRRRTDDNPLDRREYLARTGR
ncbi:elongation factor G [Solicola gregarius]|uniref:TetM/TetW/TetO/TetS family tetracycline resistance ribosomal protection protein n=1 Tax=Solicola gregarius TaxID=2908642 RepID=A0AA46TH84_9ACTN|nr:TetM/TetW/TetO/TetS family tetracycline resistance ribosomal protection protein [Solicola gregarius]UYM05090.1 TetM/TetW/TetO/TetS family tetracycline resistance ribosomal protection protein [Solicola gregarius]